MLEKNDSMTFPTGYVCNDKDLKTLYNNYYSSQSNSEKENIKYKLEMYKNYKSESDKLNVFIKECSYE